MTYLTLAEIQEKLPNLLTGLTTEPIVITQDGKPTYITLSLEQFESLLETLTILSDREFMEKLRVGIEQVATGNTLTIEELKAEFGF